MFIYVFQYSSTNIVIRSLTVYTVYTHIYTYIYIYIYIYISDKQAV